MNPMWKKPLLVVATSLMFAGCSSSNNDGPFVPGPDPTGPVACDVSGLEGDTVLLTFMNDGTTFAFASGFLSGMASIASQADDAVAPVAVSGLAANEFVIGADFDPATLDVIAVTNMGAFYRGALAGACESDEPIDLALVALTDASGQPVTTTPSDRVSISFNPTVNAFRVVKGDNTNLRYVLNADGTGLRALAVEGAPTLPSNPVVDSALMYDAGDTNAGEMVSAVDVAYTNQTLDATGARPTATEVFVLDIDDVRFIASQLGGPNASEGNPNLGRLVTLFGGENDPADGPSAGPFIDIDPELSNTVYVVGGDLGCPEVFITPLSAFKTTGIDEGDEFLDIFCDGDETGLGAIAGARISAVTVVPKAAAENLEFVAAED